MANYLGIPCPVCKEKFQAEDDIVVCPDCGAPFHRACWAKTGRCLYEDRHAAGFVWQAPDTVREETGENICPNCGARNPAQATSCEHCGVPLTPQEPGRKADTPIYAQDPRTAAGRDGGPRFSAYAAGADGGIYRRELGPDDDIDGIKARDWASYVGRSSPYYLLQFFRMSATRRRAGVCLSAFFLGPVYFFYRKMWREGILFTTMSLLLQLPEILALLASAGVPPMAGWSLGWLGTVVQACYTAGWVLRVVMSLFALYWYKQTAARRIQDIYARFPEGPDRADALALTGGTSWGAVLLYLLAMALLSTGLAVLVGPYLQTLLYTMTL